MHLRVVGGNRDASGVGVLNHLLCNIVEDEVGFVLANVVGLAIMFLHPKENYIYMSKYKTIKI
jgi:hypothetical protein